MLFYRAALPLPAQTLSYVAGVIRPTGLLSAHAGASATRADGPRLS